jgi:hypothetical protein
MRPGSNTGRAGGGVSILGVRQPSESRPGYLVVAERALQRGETQEPFPFSFFLSLTASFFISILGCTHHSYFLSFGFLYFFLLSSRHFFSEINTKGIRVTS